MLAANGSSKSRPMVRYAGSSYLAASASCFLAPLPAALPLPLFDSGVITVNGAAVFANTVSASSGTGVGAVFGCGAIGELVGGDAPDLTADSAACIAPDFIGDVATPDFDDVSNFRLPVCGFTSSVESPFPLKNQILKNSAFKYFERPYLIGGNPSASFSSGDLQHEQKINTTRIVIDVIDPIAVIAQRPVPSVKITPSKSSLPRANGAILDEQPVRRAAESRLKTEGGALRQ